MNISIRTLQPGYLLLSYLCFCMKYFLNLGPFETLLQNFCISFFIVALIFSILDPR